MRKLASITLVLFFSAIYYISTVDNKDSIAFQTRTTLKGLIKTRTESKNHLSNTADLLKNVSAEQVKEISIEAESKGLTDLEPEQLGAWVAAQSSAMNSTENNSEQLTIKYKALVKTLKPEQLEQLVQIGLNTNLPINNRIMAAYMVSLNQDKLAADHQLDIAKKALPDNGPILPHSEAELKHAQELAIRYMQVDEMAEHAKTDANSLDKLKLLSEQAESEEVRRYVLRKLKELGH